MHRPETRIWFNNDEMEAECFFSMLKYVIREKNEEKKENKQL